jgi:hypothetical protein
VFKKAWMLARGFTRPIVISRKRVDGECEAGLGTYILLNADGWFVTANHIMQLIQNLTAEESQTRQFQAAIAAIEADQNLNRKDRRRKLAQLGHLKSDAVDRWSPWWGLDGVGLVPGTPVYAVPTADIAVSRLTSLDTSLVPNYPIFKKVSSDDDGGTSLCRLGFPLWDLKPQWDEAAGGFSIVENMPPPVFANEGILARQFEQRITDPAGNIISPPFRLRGFETSNPGLLGQSGGPIFDQNGIVWGVQTATISYQLDLNTPDNQYYNVGVGCHAETVIGLLNQYGIKHQSAD